MPQVKKLYDAVRKDGQKGHVAEILDGVAMFVPWNTGIAELHLVEDLQHSVTKLRLTEPAELL